MDAHAELLKLELSRITGGGGPGEGPPGGLMVVRADVTTVRNAAEVLTRARAVLEVVLRQGGADLSTEQWRGLLPGWFLDACGEDETGERAEQWLAQWRVSSAERQAEMEEVRPWALDNWLHWFRPENRYWFWWDGSVQSEHLLQVSLAVSGHPVPTGSMEWLLRAAGADDVGGFE